MFTRARAHQSQEQANQQGRAEKATQRANDPATVIQRAHGLPASKLSAGDIHALQRTIGNRAVQQLLAAQLAAPQATTATARPVIQAKLMVGPAGDHYEQEADRVAQQVTSEPTAKRGAEAIQRQTDEDESVQRKPLAAAITPLVQRQTEPGEAEESVQMKPLVQRQSAMEDDEPVQTKRMDSSEGFVAHDKFVNRLRANRGNGNPLPESVRGHMESQFSADFSRVRVHADGDAMALNRAIGAKAFTHGTDIYFRPGTFDPASEQGKQLLAHELTHVVQQGAAGIGGTQAQRKTLSRSSSEPVIQRNGYGALDDDQQEAAPAEKPGRLRRLWNWISGKKQTVYDPMQSRQKPALVSAGVGGLGSVTSGVSSLASLAASSAEAATGGGSGAGILGAIAGPMNVASGIYNARRAENSRQRAEGHLSTVAGLGQTFTGTALGVQSISRLANVSTVGTQALSAAVLPAQIAMGAVDMVRGGYGVLKAHARQSRLWKLNKQVSTAEARDFTGMAARYQDKRRRTGLLNQASGGAALLGGTMLATGFGIPLGIPLLIASGVLKLGALFGGSIREKYINLKRRFTNWWSGDNQQSYSEEKRAKEDEWAEYADRKLTFPGYDSERRNVERTLRIMGMHQETIDRIKEENDPAKRRAIIRSLLMRR